jgi:hypothetical protein
MKLPGKTGKPGIIDRSIGDHGLNGPRREKMAYRVKGHDDEQRAFNGEPLPALNVLIVKDLAIISQKSR